MRSVRTACQNRAMSSSPSRRVGLFLPAWSLRKTVLVGAAGTVVLLALRASAWMVLGWGALAVFMVTRAFAASDDDSDSDGGSDASSSGREDGGKDDCNDTSSSDSCGSDGGGGDGGD